MAAIDFHDNPYAGPRPFSLEDRNFFFGRHREVDDVLSLIIAYPVLLLYAQSGAGKSSLLNAGVIPLLKEEGFRVLPVARVSGFVPQSVPTPNIFVANTLLNWAGEEANPEHLAQVRLSDFLKERRCPVDEEGHASPIAAIFEQFEELFTSHLEHWKEREGFFEQVNEALEEDPLLRVVFVIREDYIAELDRYVPLLSEESWARFRLERMRERGALSAVQGPAAQAGRPFAVGAAERLVDELLRVTVVGGAGETMEVAGEFVEPVQLQVVCHSLWRDLPLKPAPITTDLLSDVLDANQALIKFYEAAIARTAEIASVEERDLREWFEVKLITPGGTRATVYRGEATTGGIANAAVDTLENLFIVRAEWRAGARWIELTHDRLIEPIQESNRMWLWDQGGNHGSGYRGG